MTCEAHKWHYTSHVNHLERNSHSDAHFSIYLHPLWIPINYTGLALHYKKKGEHIFWEKENNSSQRQLISKSNMPDKIQNTYHWWIITAIWWVSSRIIFTTVPITLNVTCLVAKYSWSDTTPMSSVLFLAEALLKSYLALKHVPEECNNE